MTPESQLKKAKAQQKSAEQTAAERADRKAVCSFATFKKYYHSFYSEFTNIIFCPETFFLQFHIHFAYASTDEPSSANSFPIFFVNSYFL